MESLNKNIYKKTYKKIKVMQFGEGNFLRAFVDWIIKKMNDKNVYDGHVVVIQPLEFGRVKELERQDGLYTLYLQGVENGKVVRNHEIIDVLDDFINPYIEYDKFLKYAESADLETVISNTTEAGIALDETDIDFNSTPKSFPGKALALLKHRYDFFNGDLSKGLNFIACELIDNNGDELKRVILELSKIKGYDENFINWINNACAFTSTLVDRIVPGYPKNEIDEITNELGYIDTSIVKGEIFHLWVLNKNEKIEKAFPCDKAGLNVIYADSIKPYKERKVKILNGCHTSMVPVSYLYGIDAVKESIEDEFVGSFAKHFIFNEVVPTIKLPEEQMISFSNSVLERYLNPFVRHELMSIALNSISKYKARVLPTVKDYFNKFGKLPNCAIFSLAALIKFYYGKRENGDDIKLNDDPDYLAFFENIKTIKDDSLVIEKVLTNESMFGEDLTKINGLKDLTLSYFREINSKGMKVALKNFVNKNYE